MAQEYGLLLYDVPSANGKLYSRIRSKITKRSIMLNLSAYLIPWGMKDEFKAIIDGAVASTGQHLTVNIVKFDSSDQARLDQMAKEALFREVQAIGHRLKLRLQKARKEITAAEIQLLPGHLEAKINRQLQKAEGLGVLFGFTDDIEACLKSVREASKAELLAFSQDLAKVAPTQLKLIA